VISLSIDCIYSSLQLESDAQSISVLKIPIECIISTGLTVAIVFHSRFTPEFLRDLSTHVGVYDLGSFMEFSLQSPLKMADIFPGLMMVTHGVCITNCGLLAHWLKESPTSPLPVQLRTNSHPDWFRISPDLIMIDL
jgi:hypothetical protein